MLVRPRVAVIVLNWNGLTDTLACLESLRRVEYPSFAVIVVDNGSTDNSAQAIQAAHPEVTFIETGANLGFAGGNNCGIRLALQLGFDYLLLLNNDTVVHPLFLTYLIEAAEANPAVGVVAPKILYHSNPERIWCAGARIDWRSGSTARLRAEEEDDASAVALQQVDFVSGCAMCIRREVFETVGLLDERYYLYFEETDWCVRATRRGYCMLYVPAARIWHKVSAGLGSDSATVRYYMTRNSLLFVHEHVPTPQRWLILGRVLLRTIRVIVAYTVKSQRGARRAKRNAHIQGILDFAQGRLGAMEPR